MLYHQHYESEVKAREEARKAYDRVASVWKKESCTLVDDPAGNAMVLTHPDIIQGVVTARYEW